MARLACHLNDLHSQTAFFFGWHVSFMGGKCTSAVLSHRPSGEKTTAIINIS
jgi:hypothetical protein